MKHFSQKNTEVNNQLIHFSHMVLSAPDTLILVNAEFDLVQQVNIEKLQFLKSDIPRAASACFREFLEGFAPVSLIQLKSLAKKVRHTYEPDTLEVDFYHDEAIYRYEIRLNAIEQQATNLPSAKCLLTIRDISNRNYQAVLTHHVDPNNPEQAHLSKADLMSNMFTLSSDGIIIFDDHKRIVMCNPAFEKMIGSSQGTMDNSDNIVFLDSDGEQLHDQIWQAVFYALHWSGEVFLDGRLGLAPYWLTVDVLEKVRDECSYYYFSLREISELKQTQANLEHIAKHDQLTGLLNRSDFITQLNNAVDRSIRHNSKGALFFVDLDNFKCINDSEGHLAGDVLLLNFAARLKKLFRKGEIISRIGGDEFTLIIEDIECANDAAIIAQRLLDEILMPFTIEKKEHHISCSIGISLFPGEDVDCEQLVKQADMAMYAAKKQGKNTFKIYNSKLTKEADRLYTIQHHLQQAIENNELSLFYQIQVDMKKRVSPIGVEVLLRWNSRELGAVSPAAFIPIAESMGLMDALGQWTINKALQQIQIWDQYHSKNIVVSINISRVQLSHNSFSQYLIERLDYYGVDASRIELEVTESALVESEGVITRNLYALRKKGCKIAIDDFGTGYSSLSSLQKFPLDRLKIDRSFVENLERDTNAVSIVSAIVALSKVLGLEVIAEGVETKGQSKRLLSIGCRQAQGFYYGKPIPAHEFNELFLK